MSKNERTIIDSVWAETADIMRSMDFMNDVGPRIEPHVSTLITNQWLRLNGMDTISLPKRVINLISGHFITRRPNEGFVERVWDSDPTTFYVEYIHNLLPIDGVHDKWDVARSTA